jgi:serine/threonine protein phosphatase PrpC
MPALYEAQIRTHTGSVREINEDHVSTVLDWRGRLGLQNDDLVGRGHLFVVADGMGGHAAGEVASQTAVETLFRAYYTGAELPPDQALSAAIAAANARVIEEAEAVRGQAGMGTTLVAALLHGRSLLVANVGDSRAYLCRRGQLTQISQDHSWVAEQMAAGMLKPDEAARHPYRNVVTHSLGPDRDPTPDFFHLTLEPGDQLLLCSDGLSNVLAPAELAAILAAYPSDEAADLLLTTTLERGAPDNVTLALVTYVGAEARGHRRRWLWLAVALALLSLTAFLARDRWPGLWPEAATATPPVFASPSPTTAPPPTAPAPVVRADVIRVGEIELAQPAPGTPTPDFAQRFGLDAPPGGALIGLPLPEYYLFYLEGPAELTPTGDGWQVRITHQGNDGAQHRYTLSAPGDWLPTVPPPVSGESLGVIARPVTEANLGAEIALEPLLLLRPGAAALPGRPLWLNTVSLPDWLAEHGERWVYTVFGPGGGEGLGVETPPGLEGAPIVLWGAWALPAPDRPHELVFHRLDPVPYEWQGEVYRQQDS